MFLNEALNAEVDVKEYKDSVMLEDVIELSEEMHELDESTTKLTIVTLQEGQTEEAMKTYNEGVKEWIKKTVAWFKQLLTKVSSWIKSVVAKLTALVSKVFANKKFLDKLSKEGKTQKIKKFYAWSEVMKLAGSIKKLVPEVDGIDGSTDMKAFRNTVVNHITSSAQGESAAAAVKKHYMHSDKSGPVGPKDIVSYANNMKKLVKFASDAGNQLKSSIKKSISEAQKADDKDTSKINNLKAGLLFIYQIMGSVMSVFISYSANVVKVGKKLMKSEKKDDKDSGKEKNEEAEVNTDEYEEEEDENIDLDEDVDSILSDFGF